MLDGLLLQHQAVSVWDMRMDDCQHHNLDPIGGTCLSKCVDCDEVVGEPRVCKIGGCDNETVASVGLCEDCWIRTRGTPEQIGRYNSEQAWVSRSFVPREINLIIEMINNLYPCEQLSVLRSVFLDGKN